MTRSELKPEDGSYRNPDEIPRTDPVSSQQTYSITRSLVPTDIFHLPLPARPNRHIPSPAPSSQRTFSQLKRRVDPWWACSARPPTTRTETTSRRGKTTPFRELCRCKSLFANFSSAASRPRQSVHPKGDRGRKIRKLRRQEDGPTIFVRLPQPRRSLTLPRSSRNLIKRRQGHVERNGWVFIS